MDYVPKSDAYYVDLSDKSGLDSENLFVVTDKDRFPLASRKATYPVDRVGNITARGLERIDDEV